VRSNRKPMPSNKEIIISGIKPTGRLHIGNYLGAIKQWVELQHSHTCYFFIADWHSMTDVYDPKTRYQEVLDMAASLLALGIDTDASTLFVQSRVLEHTELCWIFNTITPMAYAERMTQYKDQAQAQKKNVNVGLFDYPVLQAADILIYKATAVPVGKDQVQHVELTRDIARFFNSRFGKTFSEPKALLTATEKVMSPLDPEKKKMSKSLGDAHCLYLDDAPGALQQKLRRVVTDTGPSGKGRKSPGVENLFALLNIFGSIARVQAFELAYAEGTIRYAELKNAVADAIASSFAEFRKKKEKILADTVSLERLLEQGAVRAQKIARDTMREVRKKTGLSN